MDLKSRVGETTQEYREPVTESRLRAFSEAIGAQEMAEAPATYLTTCRSGVFDTIERLGFKLSDVLHGEQEYEYQEPILAGDTLIYFSKLAQALEKRGTTPMTFLVIETTVKAERKGGGAPVPVGISKTTVILRQSPKGASSA